MSGPTLESWLEAHPYLRPISELRSRVDRAASEVDLPPAAPPRWEDHRPDFEAGIPLLASASNPLRPERAAALIADVLGRLEAPPLPAPLAAELSELAANARRSPELSGHIVAWLLGEESVSPPSPGLLRFVGWTVLARHLRPVVGGFGQWREEERWLRRYCPTCGSLPAMAHIAGVEPARQRLLSCGCCGTRWRYRRTQCPFCENDAQRLLGIQVEGEAGLRIDHCDACKGYLKTYDAQGAEELLLADWSSLHLDLIAHRRGLRREACSLYDLDSLVMG